MIHDIPWHLSSRQPRSANVALCANDIMESISAKMLLFSFNMFQPLSSQSGNTDLIVDLKTPCSWRKWPKGSPHCCLLPFGLRKKKPQNKNVFCSCCCFPSTLLGPTFVISNQMQRPSPSLVKRASSFKFPACVLSGVLMVNRRNT